jgi:N6-L-threonylcarbamoyladenine synthase
VRGQGGPPLGHADIAASFQEAVVDMLLDTAFAAARHVRVDRLVIAGGVSANSRLRARARAAAAECDVEVIIPAPGYCTDNAAMIALAASYRLARGERDDLTLNAAAVADLGTAAPAPQP